MLIHALEDVTEFSPEVALSPLEISAAHYATRIRAAWQNSVEAIFEVGRLLTAAKAALPHGEFGEMIERELPFKARTAQMLMAIAADERITNAKHVSLLPPAWGTLYELTKLDDAGFKAAIEQNVIRPELERHEIAQSLRKARRETRERVLGEKQSALPQQEFGVILADPEWRLEPWSRESGLNKAADNHYPTSPTQAIASRDIASIAAEDCALFLWATVPMLPDALHVLAAWGFAYRTHWIWKKDRIGTGYWNRNLHELLLLGVKGDVPAPAPGTQWESLIEAPRTMHSAKPDWSFELIEAYFPNLPKIELNRRGPPRPGWSAWGNEAEAAEDAA